MSTVVTAFTCRVHLRGDVDTLGPRVPRAFITVVTTGEVPTIDSTTSGRLELANWIASGDNPLTESSSGPLFNAIGSGDSPTLKTAASRLHHT